MPTTTQEAVHPKDSYAKRLAPHARRLLGLARASIRSGLLTGHPVRVHLDNFEGPLREKAACFVTLEENGILRGCVGTLTPVEPLAESVARNAFRAAFADTRFRPVEPRELGQLHIDIAILGPMEPLAVTSREALIASLRPGVDGLVLDDGVRRATFLPSVWQTLPRAEDFVEHLLRKGGWAPRHWSPEMQASTYRVHTIAEPVS